MKHQDSASESDAKGVNDTATIPSHSLVQNVAGTGDKREVPVIQSHIQNLLFIKVKNKVPGTFTKGNIAALPLWKCLASLESSRYLLNVCQQYSSH